MEGAGTGGAGAGVVGTGGEGSGGEGTGDARNDKYSVYGIKMITTRRSKSRFFLSSFMFRIIIDWCNDMNSNGDIESFDPCTSLHPDEVAF